MEPKSYWEERCAVMEGAVERMMQVLAMHIPSTRQEIQAIASEWAKIRNDVHLEYKAKEVDNDRT